MQQTIYISLDDSGVLSNKEKISVYAGLLFLSKKEKDKFITQYRKINKEIKCKYCHKTCDNICPEIKNTNILPKHKRRIMNYIKKYCIIALIIYNDKVYYYIKENKSAKGRFIDYSLRRMIKESIVGLIKDKLLDENKDLKIVINIDERSTKSNGYYNLKDGLFEELIHGINNYNYASTITPILHSSLDLSVIYSNSSKCYLIQAADLISGTIRRYAIESLNKDTEKIDKLVKYKLFLP